MFFFSFSRMLRIYHMHRYMVHIRADLLEMSLLLADSEITPGILTSSPGVWASKITDRTDEVGRPSRTTHQPKKQDSGKAPLPLKVCFRFLKDPGISWRTV